MSSTTGATAVVGRLSRQGSSVESSHSATVHVHTPECCMYGHPHTPQPRPRASPTNDQSECDFHCCSLHEEGGRIQASRHHLHQQPPPPQQQQQQLQQHLHPPQQGQKVHEQPIQQHQYLQQQQLQQQFQQHLQQQQLQEQQLQRQQQQRQSVCKIHDQPCNCC